MELLRTWKPCPESFEMRNLFCSFNVLVEVPEEVEKYDEKTKRSWIESQAELQIKMGTFIFEVRAELPEEEDEVF